MNFKETTLSIFRKIQSNYKLISLWLVIFTIGLILADKIAFFFAQHNYIGRKESSDIFFKISFVILLFIAIIKFSFYFLINYRLSKSFIFWIFGVSAIYFFKLRENTDHIIFLRFFRSYYYADIILFTFFLTVVLLVRNFFGNFYFFDKLNIKIKKILHQSGTHLSDSFLEDIPINGNEINELDSLASELIETFINFRPRQAFIIGIKAKWGYGKTTFLKRLEYKITFNDHLDSAPIILWFNTWKNTDEKGIVNSFFDLLKNELSFFNGNIETAINKYLSKLLSVVYAKEVRIMKALTDDLVGDKVTITDYYNKIENILESLDRQIIVMVDDLDRLNKNEILETIKILRNVANFKNMIFICGLDKEYIIKNAQLENNYLDKIFNLEIDLPILNENNLIILLKEQIQKSSTLSKIDNVTVLESTFSLNQNIKDKIIDEFDNIFHINDNFFDIVDLELLGRINVGIQEQNTENEISEITLLPALFFNSRRDIKRFYNYLIMNLKILRKIDDINLYDYILFHLMLFKYDWMRKNFEDGILPLWISGKIHFKFLSTNLDNLLLLPDINYRDKNIIYTILKKLFPDNKLEDSKGINQKRYFPIYLNNNIFNESFSHLELLKAHNNLKVKELISVIEDKLILNDIKAFILKEENLRSFDHYKQAVDLLNDARFQYVSDDELLNFINLGETNFGDLFEGISSEMLFTKTDNTFGRFLGRLNFHYATTPKEYHIAKFASDPFQEFFRQIKKNNENQNEEFKYLNKEFVKNKTISLLSEFIQNADSLNAINGVIGEGYEKYYNYFHFGYFYKEVQLEVQKFIKSHFKTIFLEADSQSIIYSWDLQYFAQLYVDEGEKQKLDVKADKILEKESFGSDELNKRDFIINGLDNFIGVFKSFDATNDFNENEKNNCIKLTTDLEERRKTL